MKSKRGFRTVLNCEQLETRFVLSNLGSGVMVLTGATIDDHVVDAAGEFQAVIVAGDPNGTPADSPANRVDANTATSPFAGVGSLQISANRGTFICTGTAIDTFHVLTAGHCIDLNNDGVSDKKDGIRSITFNLNLDTDPGTDKVDVPITATSWQPHPDFTGFNHPSVNDDISVITLGGAGIPAGVPTYSLATSDMVAGTTHLYMVGYGRSGDGVSGYTTNASFTIKRTGENIADAFAIPLQDDAGKPGTNEVFQFDFDGPLGSGSLGGLTLGNDKETTLGGGDSGGPSFVLCADCNPNLASSYAVAGVNTFTQGLTAPKFGSLGGGINVFPYSSWILGSHAASGSSGGGSGGNGGGPPPGNSLGNAENSVLIVPPSDVTQVSAAVADPTGPAADTSSASADDSGALSSSRTELTGASSSEPMVVVNSVSPSSDASSETGASDDDLTKTLDAVLEDWLSILEG